MQRETLFSWLCWAVAGYFAYAALYPIFPPPNVIEGGRYIFLLLAVFFFVVPVAQKIEIFNFLSFEARLKKVDDKQQQQETEIRNLQSIQATFTASLSSINQNSNSNVINFGSQRADAVQALTENEGPSEILSAVKDFAAAENGEQAFAQDRSQTNPFQRALDRTSHLNIILAINLELHQALRVTVGRKTDVFQNRPNAKYLTASQLWTEFVRLFPDKSPLANTFEYFFNVANALNHGQAVDDQDIATATFVGEMLLKVVRDTPTN